MYISAHYCSIYSAKMGKNTKLSIFEIIGTSSNLKESATIFNLLMILNRMQRLSLKSRLLMLKEKTWYQLKVLTPSNGIAGGVKAFTCAKIQHKNIFSCNSCHLTSYIIYIYQLFFC